MRKFKIFVIVEGEDLYSGDVLCKDEEEALDSAFNEALGAYTFNPVRDVIEIMEQENISDEENAFKIFVKEMKENVEYYVMEEPCEFNGNLLHKYERQE